MCFCEETWDVLFSRNVNMAMCMASTLYIPPKAMTIKKTHTKIHKKNLALK